MGVTFGDNNIEQRDYIEQVVKNRWSIFNGSIFNGSVFNGKAVCFFFASEMQ
jgi:hypothetical protein